MVFIGKRRVPIFPLSIRLILSPIRVVILIIMVVPAILIETAGENGMKVLDFIMEVGNE